MYRYVANYNIFVAIIVIFSINCLDLEYPHNQLLLPRNLLK